MGMTSHGANNKNQLILAILKIFSNLSSILQFFSFVQVCFIYWLVKNGECSAFLQLHRLEGLV